MAMTYRTARKAFEGCCMCGGTIRRGQPYCDYGSGVRECRHCVGAENFPVPKPRASIIRFLKTIEASPEKVAVRHDFRGYVVNGVWFSETVGDDAFCMGLIGFNPVRRCERVVTEAGKRWV